MIIFSNKKTFLYTFSSSIFVTAFTAIVGIISVPISLSYWQAEKYGIWSLLTSLLIYLSMTNLGINSAATTLIAKSSIRSDKIIILKNSFFIATACAVVFIIILSLLNGIGIDFTFILGKIPIYLKSETNKSFLIMCFFFLINLPLALASSIIIGSQKAYVENLFNLLQILLNFTTLLVVISIRAGLSTYALLSGLAMLGNNILRILYFYAFIYKSIKQDDIKTTHVVNPETSYAYIVTTGWRFFFIGIAGTIVWNTDNFIISNYLDLSSVTRYAITLKLYFLLFSIMGIINGSAMPIIAKEFGVANWVWINSVYSKLLVSSAIIGGLVWLIGVLFSRDIIKLWTGNESNYAGLLTVLALGGYSYLLSMVNLNSNLAATFNFTKYSPWAAWLEACLKIGLSILLLQFFGIAGVALGTFLGSLLAPAWILPLILVKGSEGNLRFDAGFLGKHFVLALLPMLSIAVLTQVFIEDQFLRILFGVCTVFVYLTICARVMPVGVLAYIRRVFNAAIFGIREKLRI